METGGGTIMSSIRLRHFLLIVIAVASTTEAWDVSQSPMYAEQRLLGDLLDKYEPSVRPCLNLSEPLHTVFGLTLVNILQLNQVADTLDTFLILQQSWHDARLQWNSSQYSGLTEIQLPSSRVWTPDIFSYDNVDSDFRPKDVMVSAYASGHLVWSTPLRLRTTCHVDLHNFPFDLQQCTLYFASWVYNGAQVNVTLWGGQPSTALNLKSDTMSKEWTVVSHGIAIRSTKHDCCKEPFPDVVVTLTLKRNPLYYMHVFIVPALLLGLLVPCHMLLPPDSCERITLGSILLASLILLILKLQEVLPSAHSSLPAVGLFYTLSLLWASLAMVSSILVLNLHSRGPRRGKVPDTIRWIFLRSLKRLVCLGSDTYYPINDMETITMRGLDHPKTSFAITSADRGRDPPPATGDPRAVNAKLERDLEEVSRQLHLLGARAHVQDSRSENLNEWRLVALVLDRVLFFVFFVIYLLCAVIVLG
ncbi:neuronal acetylcholine receptor subunit alpha-3-like [Babylonia areolata]|uniref:neuronal acetylcholine receptor subunit alpha-3-like n=1 Tax=Babylonia areolata TaxID=304850 RepID=UPI003FD4B10C